MAAHPTLRPRKLPVGIPVQAPPGWRPPLPPAAPRHAASPFRAQVGLVLRTMMLSLLVIVCMGVGWFLVNGRRPSRPTGEQLASVTPKKDREKEKTDSTPALVLKVKDPPPVT